MSQRRTTLFNIPWDDILCRRILNHLNLKEAYRIRRVCKQFYELSELYLHKYRRSLDFALIGKRLRFSGEAFNCIVTNKTNITHLKLRDCAEWMTDEEMFPVLANNGPSLVYLSAKHCNRLSETSFQLLEYLVNLNYLDLSHCRDVPNDTVVCMGNTVHGLRLLNLSHCWLIKDSAIEAVALNNSWLEELYVKSCYGVSDASVVVVAERCSRLEILDVRGCWRVTDASVYVVRKRCRRLHGLYVKRIRHWYKYEDQAYDSAED